MSSTLVCYLQEKSTYFGLLSTRIMYLLWLVIYKKKVLFACYLQEQKLPILVCYLQENSTYLGLLSSRKKYLLWLVSYKKKVTTLAYLKEKISSPTNFILE